MKKLMKSMWGILLAVLLLTASIPVQAAQSNLDVPKTVEVIRYSPKDVNLGGNVKKNQKFLMVLPGKATKLKSSNPSIARLTQQKLKGSSAYYLYLNVKKTGKTTVSFRYKSKTYKVKVTAIKYENPVSSVQIGNTKLSASKFKTRSVYTAKYSRFANKKVKVTIKTAKGWELAPSVYFNGSTVKETRGFFYTQKGWAKSSSVIRNGRKITIKGGKGFGITFNARNKTTGQQETIDIVFK